MNNPKCFLLLFIKRFVCEYNIYYVCIGYLIFKEYYYENERKHLSKVKTSKYD